MLCSVDQSILAGDLAVHTGDEIIEIHVAPFIFVFMVGCSARIE
jgi:hypothetical protein